jgi:tetratricopeptide (TPR) repeat protein
MRPPAGSLVAFATDAGRVAQDGDEANGLYTGELVKNLQTPGLSIEQVFKRTRAGVMDRSKGAQIPAEYSRLVGDDIFLAGSAPAIPLVAPSKSDKEPKALPVKLPSYESINRMAASGKVDDCMDALNLVAAARGPGDYAVVPLDALLELAKEDLKEETRSSARTQKIIDTCDKVLAAITRCLPPDHERRSVLAAKAYNRRGDCLLLDGNAEAAVGCYNEAIEFAPDDAYPLFNRGRAYAVLGKMDAAKADYTTASNPKFKQPKAKMLALQALQELDGGKH